ncbi:alpha/beta hydrolase [Acidobacteria bacterium AB60]|nr:alpha/beta hydrolase [Acidobacteria bacterium AB60]
MERLAHDPRSQKRFRYCKRLLLAGLSVASLFLASAGHAIAQAARQQAEGAQQTAPYLEPQRLIPIGKGRNINLVCLGKGSPTVVFTAGLGGWSQVWYLVQGEVAHKTRACAWDPAGLGFSSASPEPQDAVHETEDLTATLNAAHIDGPFLMVAHSAGAFVGILFADQRPNDVAGMVLLDPSIPDQAAIRQRIAPKSESSGNAGPAVEAKRLEDCAARLKNGTLKPNTADFDECIAQPLPPEFSGLSKRLARLNADPARLLTQASALVNVNSASPREAINPHRSFGNMPMIVLTAGQHPFPPDMPADLRHQIDQFFQVLASGHKAYAALSSRGRQELVEDAAHFIQFDDPRAVLAAIDDVLTAIRKEPVPHAGAH